MIPSRRYTLRDDDVNFLSILVDKDWVKVEDHREDWTIAERRLMRFRRQRILKALHLEDKR